MNDYKFQTAPFKHQEERFYLYRDKEYHGHLWEQRCGKSKITIDTAAWNHLKGRIQGLLVVAPNGVHLNWHLNELPTHLPEYVGRVSAVYQSAPNAAQRKELDGLFKQGHGLRTLCMNIEALRTEKGFAFAQKFLNSFHSLMVVDEGSMIKNMSASQTKQVLKLKPLAKMRRVLNGTPVTQSPLDVYPQFSFLDWEILGKSHVAFRNHHAVVEMQGKMKGEVKRRLENIASRFDSYLWGDMEYSEMKGVVEAGRQPLADRPPIEFIIKQSGRTSYDMDWRCGDVTGKERLFFQGNEVYPVITGYRHLDELQAKIAPHSDRVLKCDCLDLPDKIYSKRYVTLTSEQERLYKELKKECVTQCQGREMSAALAITKMLRFQQIVGGFFTPDNVFVNAKTVDDFDEDVEDIITRRIERDALPIPGRNPKIEALLEDIDNGLTGKGIIWARFQPEIKLIASELRKRYGRDAVGELYGSVPGEQRQEAMDRFQREAEPRYLVANPQCKGVSRGQNLCAAGWEWYYSNSFSLEDRLQSEDRPHSPGQNNNLAVIDCIAPGTVDDKVADALRMKKNLADEVTGDRIVDWI